MPDPDRNASDQVSQNVLERDHRTIKTPARPKVGFKCFALASARLAGGEVANMNRKGPSTPGACLFAQFAALAA
ncbi:hypothetical protein [uncultured Mameliella sp.]|uniref:hypothetical protein n=1 Tax=uncultured Mameliella sp. TaxID=1447087 RepID=UPI00260C16CE|nr:hypothetical protein [uncultured Mameliella sp.]